MAKPILLYSIISDEKVQEITQEILWRSEFEPLDIWINSPGGSVTAGWSMIAALNDRKAPVNMTVMGDASSMAFFWLLFSDNVKAYDSSNFLIHRAASFWEPFMDEEELFDIETRNNLLRAKLEQRIDEQKFIEVTGKSFDDIFNMSQRLDVRLTANQAKEIGLVNEVIALNVAQRQEIEGRYFAEIAALSTPQKQVITNKNVNIMGKLSDLIFGEKDSLLVAVIGDTQVVYTKLDKGSKIKAIGKDAKPISGTFEAENKSITVVENEITAIAEVNKDKVELEAVKEELKALKDSQITAEDVAEVLVKMQEKQDAEIATLKAEFGKAKITASNPKLPLGEFKQEMKKEDGLTRREKIEAVQKEMYEAKLKNKEA
jgi:ATP-dependent Clp protease, protease subunit